MSANKLPADDEDSFCVKRRKIRSEKLRRQVIPAAGTKSHLRFQIILPVSVDRQIHLHEHLQVANPPPILVLPFVLLLAAMAFAPVAAPQWWLKHYAKVALGLGTITVGVYLLVLRDSGSLGHTAHEYISFISLVGSLYVVAGGIRIQVASAATPLTNTLFLLAGALAANLLGTTGAAMLLIRPWIHLNRHRIAAYHVVFFIFLVANIGGCLTPIGDPPLFLGFLQGVPFFWVTQTCWPIWCTGTGLLLAIFYVMDRRNRSRNQVEAAAIPPETPILRVEGTLNFFFLAVILGAVFINHPPFLREGIMLAAAAGSYFATPKQLHNANEFNFHPITEVAVLFAGVFATMIPALAWLNHSATTLLGTSPKPAVFYWGTGGLSALLDNAPTYLGFLNALFGITGHTDIAKMLDQNAHHVLAISIGAVFFGAATYIGNGPNFLVKAIAGQRGVPTPSFMEFVLKYSVPILLPVLAIVWLIFFRD
jgi:Na+/H+ antiporter NhaD/arsenite permease-like protein